MCPYRVLAVHSKARIFRIEAPEVSEEVLVLEPVLLRIARRRREERTGPCAICGCVEVLWPVSWKEIFSSNFTAFEGFGHLDRVWVCEHCLAAHSWKKKENAGGILLNPSLKESTPPSFLAVSPEGWLWLWDRGGREPRRVVLGVAGAFAESAHRGWKEDFARFAAEVGRAGVPPARRTLLRAVLDLFGLRLAFLYELSASARVWPGRRLFLP